MLASCQLITMPAPYSAELEGPWCVWSLNNDWDRMSISLLPSRGQNHHTSSCAIESIPATSSTICIKDANRRIIQVDITPDWQYVWITIFSLQTVCILMASSDHTFPYPTLASYMSEICLLVFKIGCGLQPRLGNKLWDANDAKALTSIGQMYRSALFSKDLEMSFSIQKPQNHGGWRICHYNKIPANIILESRLIVYLQWEKLF